MTSLSYVPGRDCVNSLGIPVDNLTLSMAVERIVQMAKARDGRARLVSTLNVDFLVNSLGTAFGRPRHPELLEVLRSSDLVTADGFPILWLSKILGRPLPERVCGSDMLPAIAKRAAEEGLSLFLLGGAEGIPEQAADILTKRFPGLRIAGTASPYVKTSGPGLAAAQPQDEIILDQIHSSNADILLVGLGNPKQELWFNRNRAQLKTPVSIGVGGSFSFITGDVSRAPEAWRKLNLEWAYRILQEPKRLVGRYTHGLFKLGLLAAPVVWARIVDSLSVFQSSTDFLPLPWRHLWSSRGQSIAILALPRRVDQVCLQSIVSDLASEDSKVGLKIVDFSQVKSIALDAQQEFFNLAGLLQDRPQQIQLMGLSSNLRRKLSAARLLDLIDLGHSTSADSLDRLAPNKDNTSEFFCESYALENATFVVLGGRVSRDRLREIGFVECLLQSSRDRSCILDFRHVTLLESSGISELMPLLTMPALDSSEVLLSGAGFNTKQMLRMAEIESSAQFIEDTALLKRLSQEN